MRIALITPTGARPKQMKLCARWMKNQTYKGDVLWVIVDDAIPVTSDKVTKGFRKNWIVTKVYPTPPWEIGGRHTQHRNLLAAIEVIKERNDITHVFIIEDDDYYSPVYLDTMMGTFKEYPNYHAISEIKTIYYFLGKGYYVWRNRRMGTLFQTAFRIKLLPAFEKIVTDGVVSIDISFWKYIPPSLKYLISKGEHTIERLSIGIKGQEGRTGIGMGHGDTMHDYVPIKLEKLIGKDAKYYEEQ